MGPAGSRERRRRRHSHERHLRPGKGPPRRRRRREGRANSETHARSDNETGQVDATEAGGSPPTGVPIDYNAKTIDELKVILEQRGVDFSKFSLKGEYVEAAEQSDTAAQATA